METFKEIHLTMTTKISRTHVQPTMHFLVQMQTHAKVHWITVGLSQVLICPAVSEVNLIFVIFGYSCKPRIVLVYSYSNFFHLLIFDAFVDSIRPAAQKLYLPQRRRKV